ncbi:MAG: GFA family protein [Betaproteobacteria bacterium]|jgi:hypothetical protein|nr:GFA family protein [Betaproteobacteria bacterium]
MKVDGGCHCGFIKYEAEVDPEKVMICHCTDCQTLSGSAFRTVLPVPKERFRMLSGQPKIYVKIAESGSKRAQAFCPECGTPIYASAVSDPPSFNVRVGTLRQRAELPPKAQFWCRSALGWVMDAAPKQSLHQRGAGT